MDLQNMLIAIYDVPVYLHVNSFITAEEYHQLRTFDWLEIFRYFEGHERIKLEINDDKMDNKTIYCRLSITANNTCNSIW